MTNARSREVAVVGGGPAGLAGAEILAEAGLSVTVYDRMPSLARKLLIAGRGGLNLTHSEALPAFLARYHPPEARLREAVMAFPPQALRAWCADLGEPTFVGSSGRVFPESFKASPLLRAWLTRLGARGVAFRTRHRLVAWEPDTLVFATPDGTLRERPGATLLALGGASWPRLGSDAAWTSMLAQAGVAIAPFRPANVGFTLAWSTHFATRFAGTPLKRTRFSIDGASVTGEAVITRDGIEGGAIYALSRSIRERIEAGGEAVLELDLRPDVEEDALAVRLSRRKPGDSLSTHLRKAAGLNPVAIGLLREVNGSALPDAADRLAARIKRTRLTLRAPGSIERAISSAGGVRFDALDARFMLTARPGTFLAGEMLDWEAPTGGYLLQASFASGRAAARGLLAWLEAR